MNIHPRTRQILLERQIADEVERMCSVQSPESALRQIRILHNLTDQRRQLLDEIETPTVGAGSPRPNGGTP